jgi:hypothetical protein
MGTPFIDRCKQATGILIGTAIGGVIYGIFLQALLIQSLLISRAPIDPANWREQLTWKAWVAGLSLFLLQVGTPFWYLTRDGTQSILTNSTESGIVWYLISLILLIQMATVRYAFMRPELCSVERATTVFSYVSLPRYFHKSVTPQLKESDSIVIIVNPVHGSQTEEPESRSLIRLSYSLTLWKNWVQLSILLLEFLQLMSMALEGGGGMLLGLRQFKQVVWQLGMTIPPPGESVSATPFIPGFGVLTGFGGLYILLCGIFIALDLTVDSWLSPFLFTLLAGGFYGTITSGLLLVILYSPAPAHIMVSLLMLAYYSSTAVFVSIYRSDIKKAEPGEIRVIPTFTAIERVLKGALAGVSVATNGSSSLTRASVIFGFCCIFFLLILRFRPYSSFSVSAIRLTSVGVSGWTALIMICSGALTSSSLLLGLLFIGWTLVPTGMIVATYFVNRSASV